MLLSPPDLSRNRLAKVTNGAFVNLSNLTYLDLSYNKLVKLESASVEPLRKLHTLNISGNIQMDLYDIREAFQVISLCISLSLFFLCYIFAYEHVQILLVFGSFDTEFRVRCDVIQIDLFFDLGRFDSSLIIIMVWPKFRPLAN